MSESSTSSPAWEPWLLAGFVLIVTLTVAMAFATVIIRHFLCRKGRRSSQGQSGQGNWVQAAMFRDRLRYLAVGPIAEFVILFATLSFVVSLFWLILRWRGGK